MKVSKNTAIGKGLRTGLQSVLGTVVGLVVVVWAVPGVPEAVTTYASNNWLPILVSIGLPSGVVAWLQNRIEGER